MIQPGQILIVDALAPLMRTDEIASLYGHLPKKLCVERVLPFDQIYGLH